MALNYSTPFRAMIWSRILLTLYVNIKILKNWGGHSFREKHSLEVKCFERSIELGICDLCNSIIKISLSIWTCSIFWRRFLWLLFGLFLSENTSCTDWTCWICYCHVIWASTVITYVCITECVIWNFYWWVTPNVLFDC